MYLAIKLKIGYSLYAKQGQIEKVLQEWSKAPRHLKVNHVVPDRLKVALTY